MKRIEHPETQIMIKDPRNVETSKQLRFLGFFFSLPVDVALASPSPLQLIPEALILVLGLSEQISVKCRSCVQASIP